MVAKRGKLIGDEFQGTFDKFLQFFYRILMTESYSEISTKQRYYTNGTAKGAHLPFNFELMKQLRSYSTANDVVTAVNSWLDPMPKGYFTNWVVS